MVKTVFVPGTPVNSGFLNAINNPVFDGQDFDGHYDQITNVDLSDVPGQIKPEWTTFRDAFKVTAGSGLAVNYTGGIVSLQSGLPQAIAPGSLPVTNGTTYVYVNELGVVTSSLTIPARWCPLARIVAAGGAISSVEDLRERYRVAPRSSGVSVFGSGGYEGDITVASNTTMQGTRYAKNFTLASGITITVPNLLYIKCSGVATINGTITATPLIGGGKGFGGGTSIQVFNDSGFGLGGGGGHNSTASPAYSYEASIFGSGGGGGYAEVAGGAVNLSTARGGFGGSAVIIDASEGIIINGTINCNGSNAQNATYDTPGTGITVQMTGGGGGSGGSIQLRSATSIVLLAPTVLSARGGDGSSGAGTSTTPRKAGGGGGGGGWILLAAPSVTANPSATLVVSGGAAGALVGTGTGGILGATSGGSFGGAGGATNSNGSAGQVVTQSYLPF